MRMRSSSACSPSGARRRMYTICPFQLVTRPLHYGLICENGSLVSNTSQNIQKIIVILWAAFLACGDMKPTLTGERKHRARAAGTQQPPDYRLRFFSSKKSSEMGVGGSRPYTIMQWVATSRKSVLKFREGFRNPQKNVPGLLGWDLWRKFAEIS